MRWLRLHALAAPFGVLATTSLLAYWAESGQWNGRESLELAAKLVDLGAVLYAIAAVLVERGVIMIFWALEQRKKWREEREQRAADFRAKLREEFRAEMKQELAAWALEKGIPLNDLPLR